MTPPLDRSRPPVAGQPRPFSFPAFERRRLASGLELWLAPIQRLPLIECSLVLGAGATLDPPSSAGLAQLTAAALDEGTELHDSRQLAETVERLGGSLATGAGWDTLEIACGLLAEHLDTGLELVAEIARRPTFPRQEVGRIRSQTLAEIARRETQPSSVASRCLMEAIYGEAVYGRPKIGTSSSVAALGRDAARSFYRRQATTHGAALILCGAFESDPVTRRLEHLLGDWPVRRSAAPSLPDPRPAAERTVTLVDRPGAQTELRLGHAGPPRHHPDFLPLTVLNTLLGGKFMSRINLNLRERHGFTYGASTWFDWRRGPGPFVVATAVATEHAAAAAEQILAEIEKLRREPVPAAELAETKNYLLGVFPYSTQTLGGVVTRLRQLAVHDLPVDYYDTWAERLAGVTSEQVLAVARTHLQPDCSAVVAVGPADDLRQGFEGIGRLRTRTR